jgi:ATP-dependent 26S proteasome regulatory subunit
VDGVRCRVVDCVPYSIGVLGPATHVALLPVQPEQKSDTEDDVLDSALGFGIHDSVLLVNLEAVLAFASLAPSDVEAAALVAGAMNISRLSRGPATAVPTAFASLSALCALGAPSGSSVSFRGTPLTVIAVDSELDAALATVAKVTGGAVCGTLLVASEVHCNLLTATASQIGGRCGPVAGLPPSVAVTIPAVWLQAADVPNLSPARRVTVSCLTDMVTEMTAAPEATLQADLRRRRVIRVTAGDTLVVQASTHTGIATAPAKVEAALDVEANRDDTRCGHGERHVFRIESVEGGNEIDIATTEVALITATLAASATATQVPLPAASSFDLFAAAASVHPAFGVLLRQLLADGSRDRPWFHLLVVHGSPQNAPGALVNEAVGVSGFVRHTVDARLVDAQTVTALIAHFLAGVRTALVVRHCEALDAGSELLRFIVAAAAGAEWARDAVAMRDDEPLSQRRQSLVEQLTVITVFEGMDEPPATVTAVAAAPTVSVTTPNDAERTRIVTAILAAATATGSGAVVSKACPAALLSSWAVGLGVADLVVWLSTAVRRLASKFADGQRDAVLDTADFNAALHAFQQQHGHNLTSTKLQPVKWDDVGGLEDAKREILETIELPLKHPELFKRGAKQRAGVLMYGPPGCGKTLLAKAIATEMGLNFISVKGPELINMYVGESERNIRLLFQRARDNSPCIAFFDELDALAPKRGAKGDSGGVMDRIVAQLLAEVDGVGAARSDGSAAAQVFIIGATNRPDLLDPSLLRPGRFDRLCYLGPPSSKAEQVAALRALTRKFHLGDDVSLAAVAEPLPPSVYTGADYFALCSDAMMLAVDERVAAMTAALEAGAVPTELETRKVCVEMRHFEAARDALKPSVAPADLRRYEGMKSQFAANGGS